MTRIKELDPPSSSPIFLYFSCFEVWHVLLVLRLSGVLASKHKILLKKIEEEEVMIGWTFICAWVRRYITLIYMGMAQLSLIRAYGSRAVLRLLGFFFFFLPLV